MFSIYVLLVTVKKYLWMWHILEIQAVSSNTLDLYIYKSIHSARFLSISSVQIVVFTRVCGIVIFIFSESDAIFIIMWEWAITKLINKC